MLPTCVVQATQHTLTPSQFEFSSLERVTGTDMFTKNRSEF